MFTTLLTATFQFAADPSEFEVPDAMSYVDAVLNVTHHYRLTQKPRGSRRRRVLAPSSSDWVATESPLHVSGLQVDMQYTMEIRSMDAAGNAGAAALHTWCVSSRRRRGPHSEQARSSGCLGAAVAVAHTAADVLHRCVWSQGHVTDPTVVDVAEPPAQAHVGDACSIRAVSCTQGRAHAQRHVPDHGQLAVRSGPRLLQPAACAR